MSIFQAVVKGVTADGDQLRNVHHYEFPGYVPSTTEAQEFADGLADHYDTWILGAFSSQVTMNAIDLRRVDTPDEPTVEYVPASWPAGGLSVDAMMPGQLSAYITWKAATTFPRTCRTYLFPCTEGSNTGQGRIELGLRTAMENFATAMEVVAITAQTDANKVSVRYEGDPRVVVASNPVLASPITPIWGTQRRRRQNVGI